MRLSGRIRSFRRPRAHKLLLWPQVRLHTPVVFPGMRVVKHDFELFSAQINKKEKYHRKTIYLDLRIYMMLAMFYCNFSNRRHTDSLSACAGLRPGLGRGGMVHSREGLGPSPIELITVGAAM